MKLICLLLIVATTCFSWFIAQDAPTIRTQSSNKQLEPQLFNESNLLPGKTMLERLDGVSQLDLLADTQHDAERCSCAAGVNAYLLLGGSWQSLAKKFILPKTLTYESIHRCKTGFMQFANVDGEAGNLRGLPTRYDVQNNIIGWSARRGTKPISSLNN